MKPMAVTLALSLLIPWLESRSFPMQAGEGADIPVTAESVGPERHAGRWYEIARIPNRSRAHRAALMEAWYHPASSVRDPVGGAARARAAGDPGPRPHGERPVLLNRFEYALMNNPLRALIQRHFEAARLLRMGGLVQGGAALEIGCGRGVGAALILDLFGADTVDAFDLDPRMVAAARRRLGPSGSRARFWVGDATRIPAPDSTYDAVFDFGIIHHIPRWRLALAEVRRVLKPGGRFYAEEALERFIEHPLARLLLEHPQNDRFDGETFCAALAEGGLKPVSTHEMWGCFAWFVATRPTPA